MARSDLLVHLRDLVESAVSTLPETSWRRMFGCDAVFVRDRIFGMVWKHGRVGVKLPEYERYVEAMQLEGSEPWAPGGKQMSGWVLLPEELVEDADVLASWLGEAHAEVVAAAPKAKPKKPAKAPAKKAAPAKAKKPAPAKAKRAAKAPARAAKKKIAR